MLLIYTGSGKGKTCACVGQALRAHGRGISVAFLQFMKRPDQAGEQRILSGLLGERFLAGGKGFFRNQDDREQHRHAALLVLRRAEELLDSVGMLVLDESLYALGSGLLTEEELRSLIQKTRESAMHLVLSGRGLPEWLVGEADLITEMQERKHPFSMGGTAEIGIEY